MKNRIANLRAVDCVVEQALFCFFYDASREKTRICNSIMRFSTTGRSLINSLDALERCFVVKSKVHSLGVVVV